MELTVAFKQTDIGPLPSDWEVIPLSELVTRVEYGSSAKSKPKGRVPVLRMGNLQHGKIDWSDLVYTDDEEEIERYLLHDGEVLFNRTNTIDLVGKTSIYEGRRKAVFAGYLIRILTQPDRLDARYLNYVMNTEVARKHSAKVLSVAVGQANINGQKLRTYPIPVPPTLAEQQAIADTLSDIDNLVAGHDRLIAKKGDLREGVGQELLGGRTRLPGFTDQWTPKKLGDLGWTYGGLTGKSKAHFGHGHARYLTFLGVMANVEIDPHSFDRVEVGHSERQNVVLPGDLLLTSSSETPEEVAMCAVLLIDVPDLYLNSFCFGFRPSSEAGVDPLFLAYYMRSSRGRELVQTLAQGSTRYNISKRAFLGAEVTLPKKEEQTAIAAVLRDIDAEFDALQAKRTKVQNLRLAMTQELLTGRTRLIPPGGYNG